MGNVAHPRRPGRSGRTRLFLLTVILLLAAPSFPLLAQQMQYQREADVAPNDFELFESEQVRMPVAFPRYRAYVYNSTDAAAGVWIYAYRTRSD